MRKEQNNKKDTSWQKVKSWYISEVGEKGHFYHQNVVIPGALKLLNLKQGISVLDLGCGSGVLGRYLDENIYYEGFDNSPDLIKFAQKQDSNKNHFYKVSDVTKELSTAKTDFDRAACILALQNFENFNQAISLASQHLKDGSIFVIVLNHPCFRIPRQSSWEVDEKQNIQYRRIAKYMSEMKIPISANPSRGKSSQVTWSFHFSLSKLSEELKANGFLIEKIDEWISSKKSKGGEAKRENISRQEIPLFMAIKAVKITL